MTAGAEAFEIEGDVEKACVVIPAITIESVGYGTGDPRNPAIVLGVVIGTS